MYKINLNFLNKMSKLKDPNAPKKPFSAYLFFASERRPEINKEPNLPFGDVTKMIAEEWKTMTDEQKKKYVEIAERDKQRYLNEKAVYGK